MVTKIIEILCVAAFLIAVPGDYSCCRAEEKKDVLCSITDFADSSGFSWQWERSFFRLTCRSKQEQIKFYEGNSFCLVNGVARRLPQAPVRRNGTLYLSKNLLNDIFLRKKIIDDKDSSVKSQLTQMPAATIDTVLALPVTPAEASIVKSAASASKNNIVSVATEKKSNGTLITIQLSDSLPLDITYYYPNLTLNFFGGKLDTAAIRHKTRVGVIDSVFSTQFNVSAQITAILAREIEEPMVDYVQDTKTVMISLWPKKQTSVKKVVEPASVEKKTSTIIVIDPGHGGKDPGAISAGGVREKDVVLSIALKLRESLKKKPEITIFMTRDKDVFVPLSDRTEFANNKKANLFISIHADAVGGNEKRKQSTNGYKIYFLSQAKNEDDKLAAMRENAVIELEERPQRYTELQNVLIEMAGNEYLRESQDLCILIEQKFSSALSKKIGKLHKGIGQANFWVLNGAFMPSVLVEAGFLSHKKEEKLLTDATLQSNMATALCDAVVGFCKRFDEAGL